jgi:hypothetical protein
VLAERRRKEPPEHERTFVDLHAVAAKCAQCFVPEPVCFCPAPA